MISIWDMIVGSGYPNDLAYIGIGMAVFALSFLIALITLPLLIYLIEKYYTQILKLQLGAGGRLDRERSYEYDHFRIIICFLIGICILTLLIVVMSTHGLYFLYKIYIYEDYLYEINHEFQKNRLTYVVPSFHYVLYFLEAAYEAAEENLILWGFLFLVNFICKLTVKQFYFKIFTIILSIRVVFVFVCHFNIWELFVNCVAYHRHVQDTTVSNIQWLALATYPFHTIPKALRVLEILCSLIVFIPFALYIRRLIAQELTECNLRDENNIPGEGAPLCGYNVNQIYVKQRAEIEFAKKYLRGYTVFLIIHLILNLLECHFISLTVYSRVDESTDRGNNAVIIVEMVISFITDILSFAPSFLFLLFITYFVYSTPKRKVVREDEQDGELEQRRTYKYKRYTLTSVIILFCSLFCTGLIGYLRFTDGDSVFIELKKLDFILLNETRETNLSKFVASCDQIKFSKSPQNKLTQFDFLTLYYARMVGNLADINFYEDYDENPFYIDEEVIVDMPDPSERLWFPANTCLHNIQVCEVNAINYTLVPVPYPCYELNSEGSANHGLRILCSEYEKREKTQSSILFCTTNVSLPNNSCCIQKDSIITPNTMEIHRFTAKRPRYIGKNAINSNLTLKSPKKLLIEFNHTQVGVDVGNQNSRIFFITCLQNQLWAAGILILIFLLMGTYLSVCFLCLSALLSFCFI